jgi:hypothetical protein
MVLTRGARMRNAGSSTQGITILLPRERVEEFTSSREAMVRVAGSKHHALSIERLQVAGAPADRGTEVYLTMRGVGKYDVKEVLRRLKALLETGETPTGKMYA